MNQKRRENTQTAFELFSTKLNLEKSNSRETPLFNSQEMNSSIENLPKTDYYHTNLNPLCGNTLY
ncbi:MAG: hypothetical protein H0W88_06305 [Parachlamydiaceae bacterium]|nr:hypothetical protein [Parachlamydiaceae bacterium]